MMHLRAKHFSSARQRGAVSVAIAMLMMFILAAAVMGALKMSSSSVIDAAKNEEQVSALFLAESGLERALATLRAAALASSYNQDTCTGLVGPTFPLGRGSFTYTNAVSYDQNGAPGGNCSGGNCTQCVVTVKGLIGTTSSRTIQAQLIATQQNGTTGQTNTDCPTANCTPNVAMNMTVRNANSFAFVHILFNPTTNWGGSPVTPSCKDTGSGSLTACTLAWNISGNYYNNPASIGVYAPIASPGIYSITEEVLTTLPSTDSRHNFAAVGAIFSSSSGAAAFVGSFAKSPTTSGAFPNKHVTSSSCDTALEMTNPRTQPLPASDCTFPDYQHAYLDSGWTCNPSGVGNTTANWLNAGTADTLIAGFGGKPYYPGRTSAYPDGCANIDGVNYYHADTTRCSNHLNAMTVNGQPLFMQLSLDGQQGDYMYSQLWWTHNPAYYPSVGTASTGASFTGAIGASVTGTIGARVTGSVGATLTNYDSSYNSSTHRTTLVPNGNNPSGSKVGVVHVADTLYSSNCGNTFSNALPLTVFSVSSGLTPTITLTGGANTTCNNKTFSFSSNILEVATASSAANGTIYVGDTVTGNGIAANTTISSFGTATGNTTGTVNLSAFTGSTGGNISINVLSTRLNVRLVPTGSGALEIGAVISGTGVTGGPSISSYGSGGTANTPPTQGLYNLSGATGPTGSQTMTSTSTILSVATMTSGALYASDPISTGVAAGTTITGNALVPYLPYTGTTGTGSNSPATYKLSGAAQHVDPGTAMQTFTKTVTLTGGTPSSSPAVGTALAVVSGTGQFLPDIVTGSISGTTLTVTATTGSANLSAGDALFGANVQVNTTIVSRSTGTTGNTGTYTITPSQAVASGTIIARAAVASVASANSFTVSRLPIPRLSGAQICGGLCPVLTSDGVHPVGEVGLSNIVNYDDWSSGFSCVKGINPANVLTVVNVMSSQGTWSEVVK